MSRKKHLNRRENKARSEDQWDHIPGVDGYTTRIEIKDAMDVQDRSVTFDGDKPKKISVTDVVQGVLVDAGHRTRNTDQYMKYFNALINDRLLKVDSKKKEKQEFDEIIESLHPEQLKNFEKLIKIPITQLNSKEISKVLKALSEEKGITLTKLDHFKNRVKETEEKLLEQDQKIKEIQKQLQENLVHEKHEKDLQPLKLVQEHLKIIRDIFGIEKFSKAIKLLKDPSRKMND